MTTMTMINEADVKKAVKSYHASRQRKAELLAQLDAEINTLRNKYAPKLEKETKSFEVSAATIEEYANRHKDELLDGDAKSTTLFGTTIGWKNSAPALQLLEGKDEDYVLKRLKAKNLNFIITKEKIDKTALKNATDEKGKVEGCTLKSLGLELVSEERFYIK